MGHASCPSWLPSCAGPSPDLALIRALVWAALASGKVLVYTGAASQFCCEMPHVSMLAATPLLQATRLHIEFCLRCSRVMQLTSALTAWCGRRWFFALEEAAAARGASLQMARVSGDTSRTQIWFPLLSPLLLSSRLHADVEI